MKVIRIKESDIYRMVKMVLTEQEYTDHNVNQSTQIVNPRPIPTNQSFENDTISEPNVGIEVVGDDNQVSSEINLFGGLVKLKGSVHPTILKVISGVLFTLAAGWVVNGVVVVLRKRDLKRIIQKVGHELQQQLSKEEIRCLQSALNKVGPVKKIDDDKNISAMGKAISGCLWESKNINVEDFYKKLKDVVVQYGNSKKFRKGIRKAGRKGNLSKIYDKENLPALQHSVMDPGAQFPETRK